MFLKVQTNGIGSSDDSASSLEGGDDSSLGDRNALLFHGLMNTGPVLVIHLWCVAKKCSFLLPLEQESSRKLFSLSRSF